MICSASFPGFRCSRQASLLLSVLLSIGATSSTDERTNIDIDGTCQSLDACPPSAPVGASLLQKKTFHRTLENRSLIGETWNEWNKWLVLKVLAKLHVVFSNPMQAAFSLSDQYECQEKAEGKTKPCKSTRVTSAMLPDAPKFLRLGFHDCVKYTDGTGGCDGCMNLAGVFTKYAPSKKWPLPVESEGDGDNNNMGLAADVLEAIFTDTAYPKGSPELTTSLKEVGISRADLWALATMAASHFGIEANNEVCGTNSGDIAKDIGRPELCLIAPNRSMRFFGGRSDCSGLTKPPLGDDSEFYRRRAYETVKKENLPNAHADGKTVAEYFANGFGFTARQTVAIMGAHSFGKFHADTSLFKYDWTRGTIKYLNNEYYRIITLKKHLNKQTKGGWHTVGGPGRTPANWTGTLAPTRWLVRAHGFVANGGPFQWSHQYQRCPDCEFKKGKRWNKRNKWKKDWESRDLGNGGPKSFRTDHCCEECTKQPDDPTLDPTCLQWVSQDEEALAADAGLYFDFSFDPVTGRPSGCNFDPNKWRNTVVDCPLQTFESNDNQEPKKMHEIADQYAENQNIWINDYNVALEKMLANGYGDGVLTEVFSFAGLSCTAWNKGTFCTTS